MTVNNHDLLARALPLLVQLGDFIGNGPIDPARPASYGARCDLILDIKSALSANGSTHSEAPASSPNGFGALLIENAEALAAMAAATQDAEDGTIKCLAHLFEAGIDHLAELDNHPDASFLYGWIQGAAAARGLLAEELLVQHGIDPTAPFPPGGDS